LIVARKKLISTDASTSYPIVQTYSESNWTLTVSQYATYVTLGYAVGSGASEIIMTATANTTSNMFEVSPVGYSTLSTPMSMSTAPITAFGTTINSSSTVAANYVLAQTNQAGNATNNGSSVTGQYAGNSHTATITGGGGGVGGGGTGPRPVFHIDTNHAGVAIGCGMTAVVGGAAAILEVGFAITPLGMAIGVIVIAAGVLGMFDALSQ
jgi:hypothetical protein